MGPGHNWAWDIFGMGHIWPRDIFGMGHIWQDINGSGTYLVHMGHKWSGHVWPQKNLRTWLAGTCLGDILLQHSKYYWLVSHHEMSL